MIAELEGIKNTEDTVKPSLIVSTNRSGFFSTLFYIDFKSFKVS